MQKIEIPHGEKKWDFCSRIHRNSGNKFPQFCNFGYENSLMGNFCAKEKHLATLFLSKENSNQYPLIF